MTEKIRITSTPAGFAEEAIRKEWVGVEIPIVAGDEARMVEDEFDPMGVNAGGFIVRGTDAVEALRKLGREDAAAFWASPVPPRYLMFAKDCCEEA